MRNNSPRVRFPELVLHGEHNRNFGAMAKAPRDGINMVPKEKAFDGPPASQLLAGQFAKEVLQKAGRKTPILPITTAEADRLARCPAYSVLSPASLAARGITMRSWQEAVDAYLAELRHKGKLDL